MTFTRGSDNIFRDLGFSPAEAENLRIRSELLIALQQVIHAFPTQAAAAKSLGVTQPRVSDIVRGKIELFSVDTLIELLGRAHIRVDVSISPTEAPTWDRLDSRGTPAAGTRSATPRS